MITSHRIPAFQTAGRLLIEPHNGVSIHKYHISSSQTTSQHGLSEVRKKWQPYLRNCGELMAAGRGRVILFKAEVLDWLTRLQW